MAAKAKDFPYRVQVLDRAAGMLVLFPSQALEPALAGPLQTTNSAQKHSPLLASGSGPAPVGG